ncbi:SusC/RagA family TonB-linked outer membrane protein [Bacteroides clarus]|jgi:TonB-linked SusC/RagA family outer membrane protein|uniref:SusC/RagA family TonB-linked outer membrane protein n=2 Tax=Bacteroides clarus TaxID=626929 RepID=A0A1Y3YX94_9BACE|nr:SusC/RagA family TonB-linked outer membrane protein [Bacteroides clarus]
MKNIFVDCRMRKILFVAVCIRSSLWGDFCYSSEVSSNRQVNKSVPDKVWSSNGTLQNKSMQITGTVTDENGEPVIGATIQVKGSSSGVITDIDGRYTIVVPNENSILVVSFIGYESQEIKVNGRKGINVQLRENVQSLDEVTVVAYGVQKKATLTGAISSVGTDALLKSPSASVANSLAGQLPGVSSMQSSGQPGADDAKIFVRGVGSLTEAGATPLILVDGVERSFFQMDPNEIESINVLKDASATAVFGVRGANGVILVTTRRGEEGKAKISVSSNVGLQMPTRLLETADSYTAASLYTEAQRNDGVAEDQLAFQPYDLERFRLGDDPIMYPNVNWYDYLMNKVAIQTQHNVNVSGGTKDIRYFVSLGFLYQNGLFKKMEGLDYNNNYNYTRYNYRANLDVNLTRTTTLKFNMGGIVGNQRDPGKSGDIWKQLTWTQPFSSPGVIDGKKVMIQSTRFPGIEMDNQVLDRFYGYGYDRKVSNKMNFDLNLTQKLDFITKGLSIDLKGSYNTDYSYVKTVRGHIETYTPYYKSEVDGSNLAKDDPAFDKTVVYRIAGQNMMKTYGEGNKSRARDWYAEASIRYNREFGDHSVGALLLYNQSKKYYPKQFADVPTAYVGLVGRVTYDYKSKYMAEFNIGYNGSENFAPDKRFGTFPAGSIGYIITEEDFFPKNRFLTYLKIRGSVGLVGNDNMSSNRFLYLPDSYSINDSGWLQQSYSDKNGYIFGMTNTAYMAAARELALGNPNVTWETALKQNYGIDAYFFDDRLKLTADYFRENRRDILMLRTSIPSLISMNGLLKPVNIGKVNNHGYEIDLKWSDRIKDFSYYINGNISYSKNKIIFQDEVEPNEPYMWRTGNEVGARFGFVAQGFYDVDDFNADGTLRADLPQPQGNKKPGDVKCADLNGDNVIDSDDVTKIGNPKRPAYTFGLNFGGEYKGFFASMNWTGVAQCDMLMSNAYMRPFFGSQVLYQYMADGRWTPETAATAEYPRLSIASTENLATSRVWLKDASYIKLKNLTVGYNITSQRILKAIGASKLSVQFTGYNLLTFDKLKIFDPEGELTRDDNTYPIMKIFSLGVNVTF